MIFLLYLDLVDCTIPDWVLDGLGNCFFFCMSLGISPSHQWSPMFSLEDIPFGSWDVGISNMYNAPGLIISTSNKRYILLYNYI